jgi:hypothetical protein
MSTTPERIDVAKISGRLDEWQICDDERASLGAGTLRAMCHELEQLRGQNEAIRKALEDIRTDSGNNPTTYFEACNTIVQLRRQAAAALSSPGIPPASPVPALDLSTGAGLPIAPDLPAEPPQSVTTLALASCGGPSRAISAQIGPADPGTLIPSIVKTSCSFAQGSDAEPRKEKPFGNGARLTSHTTRH